MIRRNFRFILNSYIKYSKQHYSNIIKSLNDKITYKESLTKILNDSSQTNNRLSTMLFVNNINRFILKGNFEKAYSELNEKIEKEKEKSLLISIEDINNILYTSYSYTYSLQNVSNQGSSKNKQTVGNSLMSSHHHSNLLKIYNLLQNYILNKNIIMNIFTLHLLINVNLKNDNFISAFKLFKYSTILEMSIDLSVLISLYKESMKNREKNKKQMKLNKSLKVNEEMKYINEYIINKYGKEFYSKLEKLSFFGKDVKSTFKKVGNEKKSKKLFEKNAKRNESNANNKKDNENEKSETEISGSEDDNEYEIIEINLEDLDEIFKKKDKKKSYQKENTKRMLLDKLKEVFIQKIIKNSNEKESEVSKVSKEKRKNKKLKKKGNKIEKSKNNKIETNDNNKTIDIELDTTMIKNDKNENELEKENETNQDIDNKGNNGDDEKK